MNTYGYTYNRYLGLLRDTLTYELWDEEPAAPVSMFTNNPLVRAADKVLGLRNLCLARRPLPRRVRRNYWPSQAFTMIRKNGLDNIWDLVWRIGDTPGDFVECGVWRGGASIFAKACLDVYHPASERRVICCDSFDGLPPAQFVEDKHVDYTKFSYLAVSRAQVEENFRKFGLLDDRVVFHEGLFQHSLISIPTNQIAILRIDGDMYESVWTVLEQLYPKVTPGGYIIFDDAHLKPARAAICDYFEGRMPGWKVVDSVGGDPTTVWWRKA